MVFYHPKYYKELRKLRNKLDQAISRDASTEDNCVRPDPGHKLQASSDKPQAPSSKQPGRDGRAPSTKLQASSSKLI